MLKWCSYCQQFMHEIPPYGDFSITHGLCLNCEAEHSDLFATDELRHAIFLRSIFLALFEAGLKSDFGRAKRIVKEAIAANCRPVDILIGMIAPMLYEIGDGWERGALTVEDEHRFTAFCEQVVNLIDRRMQSSRSRLPSTDVPALFLMNAPGNTHTLAVRILALWLESRGIGVRRLVDDRNLEQLTQRLVTSAAKVLLISMALPEQRDGVVRISDLLDRFPAGVRPRLIVGGYAVKVGLARPIPGAELMADISSLRFN